MGGHSGQFKLVLDLVDGKLHRTAEGEMTFTPDCDFAIEIRVEPRTRIAARHRAGRFTDTISADRALWLTEIRRTRTDF